MSTFSPTISIDQAGAWAAVQIEDKAYLDANHINLGVIAMWEKALGKAMGPDHDGAQITVMPMAVRQHAQSSGIQTGNETLNLNVQSTDEMGPQFGLGQVARPIVINVAEVRACGDQAGLNNFVLKRHKITKASCQREAARHIVAGGVLAYENCVPGYGPLFSLNGIDHATYGLIEHRAFGSQTNVLRGFNRATWASSPQTQNIVMDVSSNFAANGLSQMYALRTRMYKYMRNPDAWHALITEAAFNWYKKALGGQERYLDESKVNGGWMPMVFGSMPLYVEEYMPVSTTYGGSTSNTNKASMFIVNAKSLYPRWAKSFNFASDGETHKVPGGRFEFGGQRRLPQNIAWASECNIQFNLWSEGFAEMGVLLNAESWT